MLVSCNGLYRFANVSGGIVSTICRDGMPCSAYFIHASPFPRILLLSRKLSFLLKPENLFHSNASYPLFPMYDNTTLSLSPSASAQQDSHTNIRSVLRRRKMFRFFKTFLTKICCFFKTFLPCCISRRSTQTGQTDKSAVSELRPVSYLSCVWKINSWFLYTLLFPWCNTLFQYSQPG